MGDGVCQEQRVEGGEEGQEMMMKREPSFTNNFKKIQITTILKANSTKAKGKSSFWLGRIQCQLNYSWRLSAIFKSF